MKSTLRCLGLLGLGFVCFSGCSKAGPITEIISGTVKFDGKPVANAGIRFYESRIGYGVVANLDEDGHFQTHNPIPVGCYQVSITGAQPGGAKGPNAPTPSPRGPSYIDEGYQDGNTSGLEARVSTTQTNFDFDVTKPPKKTVQVAGRVLTRITKKKAPN